MTIPKVSWIVLLLISAVTGANAASLDATPVPDAEFLEFLGSWHTGDDRWVDPFHVDGAPDTEPDERQREGRSRDNHDRKNPQLVVPPSDSRQPEMDATIPRRDVKP